MKSIFSSYRILTVILVLLTSIGNAQTIWNAGQTSKEFSIQYLKPTLSKNIFSNISGTSLSITGRISLNETKTLILQIPYLFGKTNYDRSAYYYPPADVNENTIGNIFIGVESYKENSGMVTNFGLYIPTVSDKKLLPVIIALFGDADQYESYSPNFASLSFRVSNNTNSNNGNGLGVIFRAGITGMINTKKSSPGVDDFEALLNYAVQPAFHFDAVDVLVGLSGKLILTEDGDLDQRILHQAGLSASYKIGIARLGAFGRVPLNKELSDVLDNAIGGIIAVEF